MFSTSSVAHAPSVFIPLSLSLSCVCRTPSDREAKAEQPTYRCPSPLRIEGSRADDRHVAWSGRARRVERRTVTSRREGAVQIHCNSCRTAMNVPDQAQQLGGCFTCPRCGGMTAVAPMAQAAQSFHPAPGPYVAGGVPSPQKPQSQAGKIMALCVGGAFFSLLLATLAPWIAIPLGAASTAVAILYIVKPPIRTRVNGILKVEPKLWLGNFFAVGVAGWSFFFLFSMGLWVATGGPEKAEAEREAKKAERQALAAKQKEERAVAEKAAEEERIAAEAAAKAARERELLANAEKATVECTAGLDAVDALIADEKWREADTKLQEFRGVLDDYSEVNAVPEGIVALKVRFVAAEKRIAAVKSILDAADRLAKDNAAALAMTQGSKDGETWTEAKGLWGSAIEALETLEQATGEPKKYVPPKLSKTRKGIQKSLKKAERIVTKYEKEKAAMEAYLALCGKEPVCGGWDGECVGIESALKSVAHDPSSIDVELCSDPVLTTKHCWVTTCNVRGKNAFGALILNRKRFSMSKIGIEEI